MRVRALTALAVARWIALPAVEGFSERALATLRSHHVRSIGPRRVVSNVLVVPAFQLSNPVLLVVLVEADDAFVHTESVMGT